MKYSFFILLVFFMFSCSEESSEPKEETAQVQTEFIDDFNKTFKGSIDGRYEIVMNLHLVGEEVTGSYYYTKYKTPIRVSGTLDTVQNKFKLLEFASGEDHSGEFEGVLSSDFILTGTWTAFSKAPGREKSLSFEASEIKSDFVWYSKELPFHPYYISQLLNIGDSEPEVDFSKKVELPENITMYEDQGETPSGFTIDYDEDFYMRTPFFEYNYLGKKDNLYFVSVLECGGGTGIFSGVSILELDGTILKEVTGICGGDRCNGGINESSYKDGKVYYSQNVTSEDLYVMADESIEKPQVSLDYCAACCVGEAKYEYDIATKKTSFISFESYMEDNDVDLETASDEDVFYHLLYVHVTANKGELNQSQLDKFVIEFINTVTSESN